MKTIRLRDNIRIEIYDRGIYPLVIYVMKGERELMRTEIPRNTLDKLPKTI